MALEIQVIGTVEKFQGKDSLTVDYLAACNQKALTSPWVNYPAINDGACNYVRDMLRLAG